MEDDLKDPTPVVAAQEPTPEELAKAEAEIERLKARHIKYSEDLHNLTAEYQRDTNFEFAHRTMALVFSWSNGEEHNDSPVSGFVVSYPNEFLVNSSPGKIFRVCRGVLERMREAQTQAAEIQEALGNFIPRAPNTIH